MATDLYGTILHELGELLAIRLEPDRKNTCLIHMRTHVEVYVEMDKERRNVVLATHIGEVPPGAYRERVYFEALKYNGRKTPRLGIFAFSPQSNTLVFYKSTPIERATGAYLFALLTPFSEVASQWKEALARGDIPSAGLEGTTESGGMDVGMFGLRP